MVKIKIIESQEISQKILKSSKMKAFNPVPYFKELEKRSNEDLSELIRISISMLSFMNGEKHLEFRKKLNNPMSMKSILSYQKTIEELVENLLSSLKKEKSPDLVKDFTNPLYIGLLEKVFGLKIDDPISFIRYIDFSTIIIEPLVSLKNLKKLQKIYIELEKIISIQILNEKREGILNDICKNLKGNVSDEELKTLLMTMVIASITTTETLVCILCEYTKLEKEQKSKMISQDWIKDNVDHLVRFCASTRFLTRVASEDIKFDNISLKKDEQVLIDVVKANRDKSFYKDEITFSKNPSGSHSHVAFGGGSHICSGFYFAKLVISVVVPHFFSKIESFKYVEENNIYSSTTFAKRVKSCPIAFCDNN